MRALRLLSALLVMTACATPVPIRFHAHGAAAPLSGVSNPSLIDGDVAAGRRAFISLQCIDCHRVAEDPALPRGARAIAGPELSGLARYSRHEVASRITNRQTGAGEALFDKEMKNYTEPMTARNLVDLVAYLRGVRQGA